MTLHFFGRRRLFLSAAALAAVGLSAQTTSSSLSFPEALARAAQANPRLQAQALRERAAAGLIEQAGLAPNPELGVEVENFLGTGVRSGVQSLETTVQASQRIERGGKREHRVAAAERARESMQAELAIAEVVLRRETALRFIEVLAAQQRLELAAEPLRLAERTATAVEERGRAGAGSPAEAARARTALALARTDVARAESQLAAARAQLAATWAGVPEELPPVRGGLRTPVELPAFLSTPLQVDLHPRLVHQRALVAERRAEWALEKAQGVSDVTVGGGVRFERDNGDVGFVAGFSLPLPVRHRNQGRIQAARAELAGTEQMLYAIETELRAEFAAAANEAVTLHATALALRRDALPAAKEAHQVLQRAFEAGEASLLEVLDGYRQLVSLRREIVELEAAFVAAHTRAEAFSDPTFAATAALLTSP